MIKFKIFIVFLLLSFQQIFAAQQYSYTNIISHDFFYKIYSDYEKQIKNRRDQQSSFVTGTLTIFKLSKNLIKQSNIYSNIEYNARQEQLVFIASVVNPANETGYLNIKLNQVSNADWHEMENYIDSNQNAKLEQLLENLLYSKVVVDLDFELRLNQPLATKELAKIIPVLKNAPESLALTSYPAEIYTRVTYHKESEEFYADANINYTGRADIDFYLQAISQGDLIIDKPDGKLNNNKSFTVNPEILSLTITNETLVEDMIKLELDMDNEFVSTIARHKLAMDVREKANKADSNIIKDYYTSLALFIETPISFKVTVQSRTAKHASIKDFWIRLNDTIRFQSLLASLPSSSESQTMEAGIARKYRSAQFNYNVNELVRHMNENVSVKYIVNGNGIVN